MALSLPEDLIRARRPSGGHWSKLYTRIGEISTIICEFFPQILRYVPPFRRPVRSTDFFFPFPFWCGIMLFVEQSAPKPGAVQNSVWEGWRAVGNLTLIGMPGSGKSTVGVLLAKFLGYGFLDVDLIIQQREGALLQDILDRRGVEAFLDAEESAVTGLMCDRCVIAPGGSAVCREKAARHLRSLGPVVYLRVELAELNRRIQNLSTRGIAMEPGQTLADVMAFRAPLYEQYADLIVDCPAGQPLAQTAQDTLERLRRAGLVPERG